MRIPALVSLALLASSAAALAGEPARSASFYVELDDSDQPAVASDGDVHLVVWSDRRSEATGADIFGTRIRTSDGAILDPGGFPICVEPGDQVVPQVAAGDAGSFLVVWADQRSGTGSDIYGARLAGSSVLDPGGVIVGAAALEGSDAPADQIRPYVAFGAGLYVVAWEDWRRSASFRGEVFAARFDAEGRVLDPGGIRLSTGDGEGDRLDGIASNGRTFVTVHASERFAHASVVWPDGTSESEAVIGGLDRPYAAGATSIATDGDGYLATWNQFDDAAEGTAARELRARFLTADGAPTGSDIVVREAWSRPATTWTGTDYLVVDSAATETGTSLVGTRVSPTGALLDGAGFFLAEEAGYASAAVGGGTVLVVATREDDIVAVGVHPSGAAWTVSPSAPESTPDAGSAAGAPLPVGRELQSGNDAPVGGCSVASTTPASLSPLLLPLAVLAFFLRRRR